MTRDDVRDLQVTDLERIARFRKAGYGGSVWDSLNALGVKDNILSEEFRPLVQGMQLVGRALTVRMHALPAGSSLTHDDAYWEQHGGHPQKRMMRAVAEQPDGTVLVFDCSGDRQASHFGEMSCQLAYAQGCRGMLIAGACRDTQYVMRMPDYPIFSYSCRPHSPGGVFIRDVNEPIFLHGHMTHYVTVHPGDFIFGDNDGVQVIPEALVDEVLFRVEEIFEKENREREMLAAGMPIEEVYREYGVL
jgi:4-hydroxy-4-methyl-2-oxoglutarate aldolase